MRPEGTAGSARALLSNNLTNNLPIKWYYHGPMFRHERPQKGRFRQFEQIGVEYFGSRNASSDVETIDMAATFLKQLGLYDKVELNLNTLGDSESRAKYRSVLTEYLMAHKQSLSEDSVRRLSTNPLRVLDSKHPDDALIITQSPRLSDYLSAPSQDRFEQILDNLTSLDISYTLNSNLVRGLDYYQDTVFEFIYRGSDSNDSDSLGAQQGTVLAGGRYDGLVKLMSGGKTDVPGIGWAAGIDRLTMLLAYKQFEHTHRPVVIITINEEDTAFNRQLDQRALQLAQKFRTEYNIPAVIQHRDDGAQTQRVDKLLTKVLKSSPGTRYVVFLGRQELENGSDLINYRDLVERIQSTVPLDNIAPSFIAHSHGNA
ncbi:histidyl-tRNA synthetase, class IIa [Umbelopsis sp. PMI_123]|nr:histidyl-tRNA synthetase, class IIa [Umbelopsis sp. PMI_123]